MDTQKPAENNIDSQQVAYSGSVEKILFHDLNSGYGVIVIATKANASFTATGTFPLIARGHEVQVTGSWIMHPRFGKQFEVNQYYSTTPTSIKGLTTYLGSGFIKGIGETTAERLISTFGTDVLRIIDEEPHKLAQVPGIGPKRIELIKVSWTSHKELAQLMIFLQEKGLSATYATKLHKRYRNETVAVLRENPYRLIDDIWGIGFTIADDIARKMGIGIASPQRITAGIIFCLRKAGQNGHLYTPVEKLVTDAHTLLTISPDDECIALTIKSLCTAGSLIPIHANQTYFVALPVAYAAEKTVSEKVTTLRQQLSAIRIDKEQVLQRLDNPLPGSATLTTEQKQAIITALTRTISIITGGPGTGKTTLLTTLLTVLEEYGIKYKLAAPTGRAAKRMTESSGRTATTLHRLLEFDPTLNQFRHQAAHPLKTDFVIVDECSMLDILLAQALMNAIGSRTHLVLLGDIDQLPPVGPGNFFRDCIASNTISLTRLTRVFRQGEGSTISYNAHRIREGAYPVAATTGKSDFILLAEPDPTQLPTHLKRIFSVEAQLRGCEATDITVLCPMHRGTAGTQQLNQFLQNLLNPEKQTSFMFAGTTFKCNDRVMQLRNNYDKLVFNGDMGTITEIDHENKAFVITYDQKPVQYLFEEAEEITLAYAISIHKSQGSEFPVVVIPIFMQHFTMLRRNLLYTALTRARKLCVLIGEKRAIAIALRQVDSSLRITFLAHMLTDPTGTIICVSGFSCGRPFSGSVPEFSSSPTSSS